MKQTISKSAAITMLSAVFSFSMVFLASVSAEEGITGTTEDVVKKGEVAGITFPIPELGNCESKEECKNYCNETAHMRECVAFAKSHGLMTEKEAAKAEKFAGRMIEKKGPGGCDSPQMCEEYCSAVSHLDECMSFAEKNGLTGDNYKHGKKIRAYLKEGGAMPGGCSSKETCEAYCGNFEHAGECYEFAKKSGIAESRPGNGERGFEKGDMPTESQMAKLAELAEKGETPGGCKSKDACEAYCQEQSHFEACMEFGVKAGFMSKDEAEKIKSIGGKGPGGCNSPKACHEYCDNSAHHEECFKFAEEHGFISKEETTRTKEGWVRARQGFEDAPPEVRECLKNAIGENILTDIQAGKLVPGPEIGERVRGCFEKFGGHGNPEEAFKNVPKEVTVCLREKMGDDFEKIQKGERMPTPEMADMFRTCFQMMQMDKGRFDGPTEEGSRSFRGPNPDMMRNFLRTAPPEVVACLKERLGENFEKIQAGTMMPGPEFKEVIHSCFESFRPVGTMQNKSMRFEQGHPEGEQYRRPSTGGQWKPQSGEAYPPVPSGQMPPQRDLMQKLQNMPPEILSCLKETLGAEGFEKVTSAPSTPETQMKIRSCMEKFEQMKREQMQQINTQRGYPVPPDGTYQYPPKEPYDAGPQMPLPVKPEFSPEPQPTTTTGVVGYLQRFSDRLVSIAFAPFRWLIGK